MVRTETGINERKLLVLWIEHTEVAASSFDRKEFRRWMVRAFFAEGRIIRRTNSGGNPDSALFVEHRVMNRGLTFPNAFRSPIRRRREHQRIRPCDGYSVRRVRIAYWHSDLGRPMTNGIENRHKIRAVLGRTIDQAIGVDGWIALVAGDLVVQISFGCGPVPQG